MSIKAICFDLDGVYFIGKGKSSFHLALSQEFGAQKGNVDEFMYRSKTMAALVRGEITSEEFFNTMRETLGINKSNQEITKRWVQDYEIGQEVRELVLRVKNLGYKTCVCTNNNAIRLGALEEKFGFMSDFDVIVSSHEVGECKPHEKIFTALLEHLGVEPEELVYSDDNPARLEGATKLGMHTFVYESFTQFKEELRALGIKV